MASIDRTMTFHLVPSRDFEIITTTTLMSERKMKEWSRKKQFLRLNIHQITTCITSGSQTIWYWAEQRTEARSLQGGKISTLICSSFPHLSHSLCDAALNETPWFGNIISFRCGAAHFKCFPALRKLWALPPNAPNDPTRIHTFKLCSLPSDLRSVVWLLKGH